MCPLHPWVVDEDAPLQGRGRSEKRFRWKLRQDFHETVWETYIHVGPSSGLANDPRDKHSSTVKCALQIDISNKSKRCWSDAPNNPVVPYQFSSSKVLRKATPDHHVDVPNEHGYTGFSC